MSTERVIAWRLCATHRLREEVRYDLRELGRELVEEAVPRVGVDPDPRVRGQDVAVHGWDHRVVVSVGDERRLRDARQSVQLRGVRNASVHDRVVLSLTDIRAVGLVAAFLPSAEPPVSPTGEHTGERELKALQIGRLWVVSKTVSGR